jgi:cytidyltransferase-like protein
MIVFKYAMMASKVFVSGCFDLLHSGHIAFLKTAASLGNVYVGVGRDASRLLQKGKTPPINSEAERLFMVRSVRYVKEAWLLSGLGVMDFVEDIERLRPDIFLVNEDGHTPEKASLCARLGIDYRVLQRKPEPGLPERSSSEMRSIGGVIPYRAEICGGWLDHPFINQKYPGWVVCAQLKPHPMFAQVSGGLATSTRACLVQLKAAGIHRMDHEALARLVFRYENGIDQAGRPVSGAQDAIGLCMPGVTFQYYNNGYWPQQIQIIQDDETLHWLEAHLSLYPMRSRPPGHDPLRGSSLQPRAIEMLVQSGALCKSAIENRSTPELAESLALCNKSYKTLFPAMLPPHILSEVDRMQAEGYFLSWKFTGCGGGGWLLLVDAEGLPDAIPINIATCNPMWNMI